VAAGVRRALPAGAGRRKVARSLVIEPYGCKWCGVPRRMHGHRWKPPVGMHAWEAPDMAQILVRMRARRAAAGR
jgi:hypothetical protein